MAGTKQIKSQATRKRRRAGNNRRQNKFQQDEYVRVVPLHYPKPAFSGETHGCSHRARGEGRDQDLFDGKAHPAAAGARLTYRGGPLLRNVEVFTIFWGKLWGTTASSQSVMADLNAFFGTILQSSAIDQLSEYKVRRQSIGRGSLVGTKVIALNAPVGSVTDSGIQTQLKNWVIVGEVPKATKNTLYFIYLDPGVVSIMGGGRSCQSFCGYHNNVGKLYYAVMPFPTCDGCLGGKKAFDALTGSSSHELCEAITDPVPGTGWYDDVNGEIGDICAWKFKKVDGYNVQSEWSNQKTKCV